MIPQTVSHLEMKRHWWILYQWDVVTELADEYPKYLRCGLRPINEAVEAARQFDEAWSAYQRVKQND